VKKTLLALLGYFPLALSISLHAQSTVSYRVLFGVTDTAPTRWDGTFSGERVGKITANEWKFGAGDNIDGQLFHFSTRPDNRFIGSAGGSGAPIVPNGFILTAERVNESSEFSFTTAQGDFKFRASDLSYGKGIYRLGEKVYIDRVPAAYRLTNTPEEEDYPSIARDKNGDAWLAYVEFHHSPDHVKLAAPLKEPLKDFSSLRQPVGGDQIWLQKYSGGAWQPPIAVTKAGKDQYRAAVAVDGNGRPWVFWSENRGGNFDIFASPVDQSGPQGEIQISKESGSDIDPVAVTDSNGKVWVAWQGWRDGRAAIFTAHQDGKAFTAPEKISNSDKNEWDPAIAADKAGRVAVAWDSYRNGNYDVYARTWSNSWEGEVPIAASARYEAYPSIAFDPKGRLWVAYEEGGEGWGQDFGAYSSPGIALYKGRAIRLRALEPDGRLVTIQSSIDKNLVGIPSARPDITASQLDGEPRDPDTQSAANRKPDQAPEGGAQTTAKNTLPRLTIDDSGRVSIAFRTAHPIWWSPIGTVWSEYVISFDGKQWSKPIYLDHSDNLLDNRPAVLSTAAGKLLIVNSSDGRRKFVAANSIMGEREGTKDPYNNDLWSQELDLGPGDQVLPVVALSQSERTPSAPTWESVEVAGAKAIREYKAGPDGSYHIVRGEFHRHSEISMDGGGDGTLLDQWRYVLDAVDVDWIGCCDHDNGAGREYSWWIIQKLTDVFYAPGKFTPLFAYERSVSYPEGHRNVLFAQRGIRPLPRLPLSSENDFAHAPDTQMLYAYLHQFDGVSASHTSATSMGTDWRDNDPQVEPVVEIYQGLRQNYEIPDGPRANSEKDSIGGWRPKGFISLALDKGYRLGFESSSDHVSTHISYANILVKGDVTRESLIDGFRKRHVYAATDEILADVRSGDYLAGDEFTTTTLPTLNVKLEGTSKFAKVVIIRDGKYVYSNAPDTQNVEFTWRDNQPNKGKNSYYYVRGEQDNGEIVWVSPFWITYKGD
jgi:Protein of unknown function (DUF3604)